VWARRAKPLQFTSVSVGGGPRAALWSGRGTGDYFAYRADEGQWSVGGELTFNAGVGPVGVGVQANGTGILPGGSVIGRGGFGLVDAGGSVALNVETCARGWAPSEVPPDVLRWFISEFHKACADGDD
jgi:hypothetical protein